MVSPRNKLAGILAIVGGALLFLSGSFGMVDFLESLQDIIEDLMGDSNATLEMVFWILIFIAMLGGIAVIIGGILIYKDYPKVGRILIILGTSIGLIGLIISVLSAMYHGETENFLAWLTTSFAGIGIVLAIISTQISK